MFKPDRHPNHVLQRKSEQFFDYNLPPEWVPDVPQKDYGIDYKIEIGVTNEMTGLNFSVQLKSTKKRNNSAFCSSTLKHSTLNYFNARLEPVMLVCYVEEDDQAYWCWIDDLNIDLSKDNKTYSVKIPKTNPFRGTDWNGIVNYVLEHFNKRKLIGPFDIMDLNETELVAWNAFYSEKYDNAVYLLRLLLEKDPGNINARQALAWSLYSQYDYQQALIEINVALQSSSAPKLFQTKGCIMAEYGIKTHDRAMVIQARDIFKAHIEDDKNAIAYYNYANTLSELKNYSEAAEMYKFSLQLLPNYAPIWKNLATCYHHFKQYKEEIECLDKALSINPSLLEALVCKAITLSRILGRHEEALKIFKIALKEEASIQRDFISAYFHIAHANEQTGRISEALKWINKGLDLTPSDQYLVGFKTRLLARHWKTNRAIKSATAKFFEYRFEVDQDPGNLYYIIKVKALSKDTAFQLIKEKTTMLNGLDMPHLVKSNFKWEKIVELLRSWRGYREFRHQHPLSRYSGEFYSPHLPHSVAFVHLLDLTCGLSFNQAVDEYLEKKESQAFTAGITDVLFQHLPLLIREILSKKKYKQQEAMEIFPVLLHGFSKMAFREIGLQLGYLQTAYNVSDPPYDHIAKEKQNQFSCRLIDELNNRLGLFKD